MTISTAERDRGGQIFDLALTPEEAKEVRLVLETSLADLSLEIRHTSQYELRETLKTKRLSCRTCFTD